MELCEGANVVLACRVSPKQKAEIVHMIKDKNPTKTTLAIGDGANDVNMITAAHIGIGISGLEGQQAARAADYSIGQFRFLKNLLFCHGREAYRRNSYLVCYMFYKNFMETIPLWVYGWLSLFSGTFFYNSIMYACYNVLFTAVPVVWFAVFDWEYDKRTLLKSPILYSIGLENIYFSSYVFWRWVVYAIWQAALLLVLCYEIYSLPSPFGKMGSITSTGAFVFGCIVIAVNYKLFIACTQHCWQSVTLILLSIGSYFGVFLILNAVPVYNDYGTF